MTAPYRSEKNSNWEGGYRTSPGEVHDVALKAAETDATKPGPLKSGMILKVPNGPPLWQFVYSAWDV